jgi:tetratricopeptide (TPR) repeat protein
MASHIDVHLGDFQAAVRTNLAAIAADKDFACLRGSDTYYHTYRLHSYNQLVWAASFCGRSEVAVRAAEAILSSTPKALRERYCEFVEPLGADLWFVLVRFGRWKEVLKRPEPPLVLVPTLSTNNVPADSVTNTNSNNNNNTNTNNNNFVSVAVARWAKAIAHASLGHLDQARIMRLAFQSAAASVPLNRHVHVVTSSSMLAVASKMLDGEIAYREAAIAAFGQGAVDGDAKGNNKTRCAVVEDGEEGEEGEDPFAEAFALLREAVLLDEGLPYDEPWGWMTPVAHALGALLLEQGRIDEATQVYRKDLQRWPKNMWALGGLKKCLEVKKEKEKEDLQEKKEKKEPACHRCDRTTTTGPPASTKSAYSSGELEEVLGQLRRAASQADVDLNHSCFCAGLIPMN